MVQVMFGYIIQILHKGGDNIGRILVIEFNVQDSSVFDEIMEVVKRYPSFEYKHLNDDSVLSIQGLKIYPERRKIYQGHQEINLTVKEYDLFCLFAANKGRVLTYDQIYQKVWGDEALGTTNNAIACHVHNLREKIGRLLPEGCFAIRCIREVGYCFETDTNCVVAT